MTMKKFYNLVISWMISSKRDFDLNIEEYRTNRLCASYFLKGGWGGRFLYCTVDAQSTVIEGPPS
jgi:hypothetical protein